MTTIKATIKPVKLYALFGFNPQMWYKIIDHNCLKICELHEATIFELREGQTREDLARDIVLSFPDQEPVVTEAMLVEVQDKMIREVKPLDTRPVRDWDRIRKILGITK